MKLQTTNHPYYCEAYEVDCNTTEYVSWKAFKKEIPGIDMDYNLLFRFDITQNEDYTYTLELHYVLQRHGVKQWHVIINDIKNADINEITKYLTKCKEYLLQHWVEVN